MRSPASRRDFLRHSAALGGSLLACGIPLDRSAHAAPVRIAAPTVDEIVIREITDNTHDIFLPGANLPGLTVGRTQFAPVRSGRERNGSYGARSRRKLPSRSGRRLGWFRPTPDLGQAASEGQLRRGER